MVFLAMRMVTLLLLSACHTYAHAVSVMDDLGRTVQFSSPPQRIISLLPSLTETVCALQLCDRLVGTDRYSNYPERVLALPKLGGIDDAQIERIVSLKPNLILVSPSTRAVDRMISLGLPVLVLKEDSQSDVKSVTNLLGKVMFVPERAEQLWKTLEAQIDEAAARVPASMRAKRFYFEIDPTIYAAGPNSFIGELIQRLGLTNIVPSRLGAFPRLSPEFVLRAQPDLILASQRNVSDMQQRPGWASLQAIKEGRTCGFDSTVGDVLVRPGPRMGEAANYLVQCFTAIAQGQQRIHIQHGPLLPTVGR